MPSVIIPRGGPPRCIEIPAGASRSRKGSIHTSAGSQIHGLTDDEAAEVKKAYPRATVKPDRLKSIAPEVSQPVPADMNKEPAVDEPDDEADAEDSEDV